MIKLVGSFLNSAGSKHTFSMKEPNTDLSAAKVKESLELLAALDIFEKDGVKLFQEPISAKYVETVETPIFKGEELFGEPEQLLVLNQPQLSVPTESEPEQVAEEILKEVDPNKLKEIQQHTTYQAIPDVPQVSFDQPEVNKATNEVLEEALETQSETPPNLNYRISEILQNRRNRRKAQEQPKKRPH